MSKCNTALGIFLGIFVVATAVFLALWLSQRCSAQTGSGSGEGDCATRLFAAEAALKRAEASSALPAGVLPEPELLISEISHHPSAPDVMVASIGGVASNAVTEFLEANGCRARTSAYNRLCHLAHPGFRTGLTYVYIEPESCTGPLVSQSRRSLTTHNTAKRWGHQVVDLDGISRLHPEDELGVWQHRQSFRYAQRHGLDRIIRLSYPLTEAGVAQMYRELYGRDAKFPFRARQSGNSRGLEAAAGDWDREHILRAEALWQAPSLRHLGTLDLPYGATCPMLAPVRDASTGLWRVVFRFTGKTNAEMHHTRHNLHEADLMVEADRAKVVGPPRLEHAFRSMPRPDDVKGVASPKDGDWLVWNNLSASEACPAIYSEAQQRELWCARKAGVATDPVEKNYTPFVTQDGRVMFIRWFFLLQLYEFDVSTGRATRVAAPTAAEEDDSWRGGSNGVALDAHTIVGFGRRTLLQHRGAFGLVPDFTHRVFLWKLDLRTLKVTTAPVNGPCGAISDPISLRRDGNRLLLTTVEGSCSFGRDPLTLKCEVYKVPETFY